MLCYGFDYRICAGSGASKYHFQIQPSLPFIWCENCTGAVLSRGLQQWAAFKGRWVWNILLNSAEKWCCNHGAPHALACLSSLLLLPCLDVVKLDVHPARGLGVQGQLAQVSSSTAGKTRAREFPALFSRGVAAAEILGFAHCSSRKMWAMLEKSSKRNSGTETGRVSSRRDRHEAGTAGSWDSWLSAAAPTAAGKALRRVCTPR